MPPIFNLCLLIVVAVLSLSRNVLARSNTSLASMCKKAYYKIKYFFLGIQQRPWSACCTYAQSRQSLRSMCEGIYCKYFKRVCETVLMFGVPVQTVNELKGCSNVCSHLKMSPMSNEPFCKILVLITCVSSIDSNQPAHLCSLARACTRASVTNLPMRIKYLLHE